MMKNSFYFIMILIFFTSIATASSLDGLILHYSFEGNANDISGNGNNGTVYGASLTADRFGNANSAYSFDGVDDYIDIWSKEEINSNIDTTQGSISVWFKAEDYDGFVYQYYSGNNDRLYLHIQESPTQARPAIGSNTGMSATWTGISLNNWYNLVQLWKTDGTYQMYLNGVLAGESAYNTGFVFAGTERFYLGRGWNSNPVRFDGIIDDVMIYNRALSLTEIGQIYSIPEPDSLTALGITLIITGYVLYVKEK